MGDARSNGVLGLTEHCATALPAALISGQPLVATRRSFTRWIERTIHLPVGLAAEPGLIRLPPYLREVADALTDPKIERITCMKSARLGYSTLLSSLIAYHMTEAPAPVLVVLPAELDARNFVIDIESIFDASPALQGHLPSPATAGRSSRNTLLYRRGANGASLRLVGATAPRNLRAITAKVLLVDECDALLDTAEGSAIALAEARTLTCPHRRIIVGGTPLAESTSHVARAYCDSDMRIFEVRCIHCEHWFEITWPCIFWPEGQPQAAHCVCPSCSGVIEEKDKADIVSRGRWRATRPDADPKHRGYRISALVSSLANTAWGRLASEWLRARDDDDQLKVFTNVVLGLPWAERADEIDEAALASRVEAFDLDRIPAEVLAVTIGADCQDDRIEFSILGHARDGTVFVLAHTVIYGSPLEEDTWVEVEALLRQQWRHPHGGVLRVECAVIDAGDGGHYDAVMGFCNARLGRRILAGKGVAGFARPAIQFTKTKRGRLFLIGVDGIKTQVINRLSRGRSIRFSHTLDAHYFEMLASERRVVRMARGRPQARFERKPGARAESLDALVYGLSAKAALSLNAAAFNQREDALRSPESAGPVPPAAIPSKWMQDRRPSWERYR
jgi:phage terminase large subunit GpA-like protein